MFKTWYFGHTGWSRFQTDESTTLNRHLMENDFKFQCSVFIFLRFPRICPNKVPFVSVQHFVLSILDYRHMNFQWFPHLPIIYLFSWREFCGVTSRNSRGIPLCVQLLQRITNYLWRFLVGALLIYLSFSFLFHNYILTRMNIFICTLQGSYLVLTYPCFYIKYYLS